MGRMLRGEKKTKKSFKIQFKIQVSVSSGNSKFHDSSQDPVERFKLQFPNFKLQTKIQVRVSSCNFQVSSFKPRSRSGFLWPGSKTQGCQTHWFKLLSWEKRRVSYATFGRRRKWPMEPPRGDGTSGRTIPCLGPI